MDRNRGDRYGGNNNNNGSRSGGGGDYNHDSSYHSRRPSRFSDGPSRFSDSPSRFSDGPSRFSDTSSRFSDDPGNRYSNNGSSSSSNGNTNYNRRSPRSYRGGAGGGHRPFDSPPSRSPVGGGSGDLGGGGLRPVGGSDVGGGFRPMGGGDGGGFRPFGGGGGGFVPSFEGPSLMSPPAPLQQPLSGHKREFPFGGRGSPTDRLDGGTFAKLFVGSVPRTATEEEIRPLFEQHGNVIEVALIKDKRTGQQQGCCFVKYATSEDADRAIKALHNQHTLPGGVGPIQVRYADGERERLGATEYKLFVGSLNKQAAEKEVEEIFAPYGRVEDVYLMRDERKQSRGCGFVKYAHRDMALAAISALNGTYTMRGCDQPLTVRFADPKRPRSGDSSSRGGPAFGGPGFGPRFQAPVPRPPPNFGDPMSDRLPPNAWHPTSPQGPPSNSGGHGFGTQYTFNQVGPFVGPSDTALPATAQQSFNQPLQQVPPVSQQISPLQMPLQSPQHLPPSLQLQAPISSYSHSQTSHVSQAHTPIASGQVPFSQALPSQHLHSMGAQFPTSQPQLQQSSSSTVALQAPLNINLPSRPVSAATNQLQLPSSAQQQLPQPPSQLAQMLSQQTQTLQATFQSSQQAFSQLQQQLQMLQPSNQSSMLQQSSQVPKQQWPGIVPHSLASAPPATLPPDMPPSSSASAAVITQAVAPTKCNWTEHTSPDGFKYYFNSVTSESRWEKPEELTLYERQQSIQQPQQQLQQKPPVQPQNQPNLQLPPNQQVPQMQQIQLQAQLQTHFCPQPQPLLQQPSFTISELGHSQVPVAPGSANNSTPFQQQGFHSSHEWMWKSKPSGT